MADKALREVLLPLRAFVLGFGPLPEMVEVEPGSHLAEILGKRTLRTNSLHHQAIRQPAPDLEVVGRAEDGVIEAVELPGKRFAIGVQWHPECLPEEPAMQRLFISFIQC